MIYYTEVVIYRAGVTPRGTYKKPYFPVAAVRGGRNGDQIFIVNEDAVFVYYKKSINGSRAPPDAPPLREAGRSAGTDVFGLVVHIVQSGALLFGRTIFFKETGV